MQQLKYSGALISSVSTERAAHPRHCERHSEVTFPEMEGFEADFARIVGEREVCRV